MNEQLNKIKGIHPGLFLENLLQLKDLKKVAFARTVGEHPQTFIAILKGKRKMNTKLALKVEKHLGLEEGFLMILQVYYDIAKEKGETKNHNFTPEQLKSILFPEEEKSQSKQNSAREKQDVQKQQNEHTRFYPGTEKTENRKDYTLL